MDPTTPLPASRLLEQGDHWIRQLLAHWTAGSRVTTRQFDSICCWALGERSALSYSVLSRIINGKQGVSIPHLVAMEAANAAIWSWHTQGQAAAIAKHGPLAPWRVKPAWLESCIWLKVPDEPGHPLDLCDLVQVITGRLPLPYLGERLQLPGDHQQAIERLRALLDQAITAAGLSSLEGVRRLLAAYPDKDPDHRGRFQALLLGEATLTREELQGELAAIAEAVRTLRGLPLGGYGPTELTAELSRGG